jgi:hypothetical protein
VVRKLLLEFSHKSFILVLLLLHATNQILVFLSLYAVSCEFICSTVLIQSDRGWIPFLEILVGMFLEITFLAACFPEIALVVPWSQVPNQFLFRGGDVLLFDHLFSNRIHHQFQRLLL